MQERAEEQERADVYALLAALLLGPEAALVEALAREDAAVGCETAFDQAWAGLVAAAARCGPAAASEEFAELFVASGNPRIDPYQCRYVAGWLMDKPLAQLRHDLAALGLARAPGATELEDHLGALCEAMALLIRRQRPLAQQQSFFRSHLAGWAPRCLADIAAVPGIDFYRAVAQLAQAFFALEEQAFALEDAAAPEPTPLRTSRHAPVDP